MAAMITLSTWTKGPHPRIYINCGRESLGYLERRTETRERGTSSYYDRHRIAKGDRDVVVSDTVATSAPAALVARIDEAVGFDPARAIDDSGVDRWLAWVGRARSPFVSAKKALKIAA